MKPKNMEDIALDVLERGFRQIAHAITPVGTAPGHDAAGGTVDSLTEATMGTTAGLVQIAQAINNLAEAVRERNDVG